jgi:hypothetical protein
VDWADASHQLGSLLHKLLGRAAVLFLPAEGISVLLRRGKQQFFSSVFPEGVAERFRILKKEILKY